MTVDSKKNGVVFARVTHKATGTRSARTGWEYGLSNGARMFLSEDILCLGKWYFFEMKLDVCKNLAYVSHSLVDTAKGASIAEDIQLMKKLSHDVTKMWNQLEATDRQILMRSCGIILTGAGAASAGIGGAATMLGAETVLAGLTGGLSLVIGGVLGGLTYLQYEERVAALKTQDDLLKRFRTRRALFARAMIRQMPSKYEHLQSFDPQINSIVTRCKSMIKDFDFQQLISDTDDNFAYACS